MTDKELLDQITRAIVERFQPKRILLFGSRARGDARPDSDVDIFVEMETQARPPERAAQVGSIFGLRRGHLTSSFTPRRKFSAFVGSTER